VVTAGGTREAIDPVRYIGNRSSGKMGYAIAEAARDRGAKVKLITAPTSLPNPAGVEVAQIDWDGHSTHVDWVRIDAINTQADIPIINVSNCILQGASGGGVYWQGQHIGNNWSRTDNCNTEVISGEEIVSTVALNSQTVIAP